MGYTEHKEDDSATMTKEERNEYLLKHEDFIRCARCKNLIHSSNKYCQYCGFPNGELHKEKEDTKFVVQSECLRNQSCVIGSLQRSRRDIEFLLVLYAANFIAIIFLTITYFMK